MPIRAPVVLARNCEAIQIPSGTPITLPAQSPVTITQSLGGAYTVMTEFGLLVRIDAQDADALGAAPTGPSATRGEDAPLPQRIADVLRSCYDPEIPVNILDLGLVYRCAAVPLEEGDHRVEIQMTLTAPGCGMGEVLRSDVQRKILGLRGVRHVEVELVFDPPWDRSRMSEAAQLQLGMM